MNPDLILPYTMRWLHIVSAMLAIGVPFFVRFVLTPAANKSLDEAQHQKLREAINAKWRIIVYILITLFLISGFYTFLVPVRVNGVLVSSWWRDMSPDAKRTYHMIFGIKVLAAFGIFFLASALAGRTQTFAPIRMKRKMFLTVLLLLAAVVVTCAVALRYMHA